MITQRPADTQWVRQAFMLPKKAIDDTDKFRRQFTAGYRKFSDTSLGGNAAINPPPQFCNFSDIPERRFTNVSLGEGRWYSEVIENNSIYVHMRFGVASYNSLTSFFGNFYSTDAARLARTGRGPDLAYWLGRVAGFVVSIRFVGFILAGQIWKFITQKPSTKYYYLKPTMPSYWNAVQGVVNTIAAGLGIVAGQGLEEYKDGASGLTPLDISERNRMLPTVWQSTGGLNMYAVATRYQRLADVQARKLAQIRDNAGDLENAKALYERFLKEPIYEEPGYGDWDSYVTGWAGLDQGTAIPPRKVIEPNSQQTPDSQTETSFFDEAAENFLDFIGVGPNQTEGDGRLMQYFLAEARDGAQFITLRVDDPGSVSESFSNSAKESDIASSINSMSSTGRNLRFSFANGNISDGIIGKTVQGVLGAARSLVEGFADSLSVSGLASLMGNAFVDIPKHWDQSTANLPRMQYTLELRAPYGNDISRLQSLMVPLAYLLCGALPLAAGPQSYTSPFLCEAYCKGRAQTKLGIIDSLEITRGTGNMKFRNDGHPLAIDVSFSVLDLSSVMTMPIATFSPIDAANPLGGWSKLLMADDSSYDNYMAVLTGLGLVDQIYFLPKLKRNFYKNVLNFDTYFSKAHFANYLFGTAPGRLISAFANQTNRA